MKPPVDDFNPKTDALIPVGDSLWAVVDKEDEAELLLYDWDPYRSTNSWYAQAMTRVGGKYTSVKMHRLLTDAPRGRQVDHRNLNGLDNRKRNLRVADASLNKANCKKPAGRNGKTPLSRYKGVRPAKASGRWSAGIRVRGVDIHLGTHNSEWEAAQAYNAAATEHFGEFARLNAPQ